MTRTKKKSEHYVDNKVFLQAMIEYKDKCEKAEKRKKMAAKRRKAKFG